MSSRVAAQISVGFGARIMRVVGMAKTLGDLAVNLLLRVSRPLRVQHLLHVSDVAGGRGADDTFVQCHEKECPGRL